MSVEWSVRVNRSFTLDEVLRSSTAHLQEILGSPGDESLTVIATSTLVAGGGRRPIEPQGLAEIYDPYSWGAGTESIDFLLEVPAIGGGCSLGLAEFLPRGDDPESGLFAYVTSDRTDGSYVLSIAMSIAIAVCAAGQIVDDANLLGSGRLIEGEELLEKLRSSERDQTLDAAIATVLAGTKIG
ncbi:hypothetical protein Rhe02_01510 [Rhizocola hellebori]|uniref:Uncharacterized protein n=1 Tax=Rhizocola hellebori TaxID=1392758 RepID=A0A8J3Q1U6_9ACTN|nr:hypothetical protein [Rhizocola hellebori]GIH02084.1 hypothetical protein Rhe02_01510 [Rhizocola hellebori]